jgi:dihydroneopterin aldolase
MEPPGRYKGPLVAITNLETRLRVGIWDHERAFQPVRVNLIMSLGEGCVDYRPVVRWIKEEWPRAPHTPLLETRLRELMDFVFAWAPGIAWLDAALSKPQACPEARGVGVRMALSRSEHALHLAWRGDAASTGCGPVGLPGNVG